MKADKHRQEVAAKYLKLTHAQRQEAAQQKKEEKERAYKERMMNEEDPDKQRKMDVSAQFRKFLVSFCQNLKISLKNVDEKKAVLLLFLTLEGKRKAESFNLSVVFPSVSVHSFVTKRLSIHVALRKIIFLFE